MAQDDGGGDGAGVGAWLRSQGFDTLAQSYVATLPTLDVVAGLTPQALVAAGETTATHARLMAAIEAFRRAAGAPWFAAPTEAESLREQALTAALPFPLAVTWKRLREEMDRQEPVAAAWALRDAFEVGIKFCACVAVCDVLRLPQLPASAGTLLGLLLKQGGLSVGDWIDLLLQAVDVEPRSLLLPRLRGLFRGADGSLTPLARTLAAKPDAADGSAQNFVRWRNRIFGHGVFKAERSFYAEQTGRWLPVLEDFYSSLLAVLEDWRLEDERQRSWRDVTFPRGWEDHEREAPAGAGSLVLRRDDGASLHFGPLLSLRPCSVCADTHLYFFDRASQVRRGARAFYRSEFLEYLSGHTASRQPDPEVDALVARLPQAQRWHRADFDQHQVDAALRSEFRDFHQDCLAPETVLASIERELEGLEGGRGYLHIVAPEGVGKSWLIRALADHPRIAEGATVLPYFIRAGALADYRTFVALLNDAARERLPWRTQEMQTRLAGIKDLREQLQAYLTQLMQSNRCRLILAIDGLDELGDVQPASVTITDFLPAADSLPAGCHIVLTSRPALAPRLQRDLGRLRSSRGFRTLDIDPAGDSNRSLLRQWLASRGGVQDRQLIDLIVERAQGRFLYVRHFARALQGRVFGSASDLPRAEAFYAAYFQRLRDQVGEDLFGTAYRPILLLLLAAQQPISFEMLVGWGVGRQRLATAFPELRDFLQEAGRDPGLDPIAADAVPARGWRLAHATFGEFVEDHPEWREALRATHRSIAEVIRRRRAADWGAAVEQGDEEASYDLRHWQVHLERAGLGLQREPSAAAYLDACLRAALACRGRQKVVLAVALLRTVVEHAGAADSGTARAAVLALAQTLLAVPGGGVEALALVERELARPRAPGAGDELALRRTAGKVLGFMGQWDRAHELFVAGAADPSGALERVYALVNGELGHDLIGASVAPMQSALRLLAEDPAIAGDSLVSLRARIIGNIGAVRAHQGDFQGALDELRLADEEFKRLASPADLSLNLNNIGLALLRLGRAEDAQRALAAAAAAADEAQDAWAGACARYNRAWLELVRGDRPAAARGFGRAAEVLRGYGPISAAQARLGSIACALCDGSIAAAGACDALDAVDELLSDQPAALPERALSAILRAHAPGTAAGQRASLLQQARLAIEGSEELYLLRCVDEDAAQPSGVGPGAFVVVPDSGGLIPPLLKIRFWEC